MFLGFLCATTLAGGPSVNSIALEDVFGVAGLDSNDETPGDCKTFLSISPSLFRVPDITPS